MRIAILGPLVVTDDAGDKVPIGGVRLRALLIRLALDAGRAVSTDALIHAVWGEDLPDNPPGALHALVSRLRRGLPDGVLRADAGGYRVDAATDLGEFESHAGAGRFTQALSLWRGTPLHDVADADFARAEVVRLCERHVSITEDAFAQAGPANVDVAELEAFARAHSLRERPHALLIAALAAAGRQADAVAIYQGLRARLADQTGLDPSPELDEAYAAMLRRERTTGNLRAPLTSFVGRDLEMENVTSLVRANRLLTLVGPGGSGKTRLATEVGRELSSDFPDGVWVVEFAGVREPADVPRAVADALRLHEIRVLDIAVPDHGVDRLIGSLATREMLLILDNCEHLIEAAARLAEEVLGACPGVRMLTTSREPLAITGESLCPVGPLATPAEGPASLDACAAASVRLFADRAAAVRSGFAVTEANVAHVVEVCRRLDGMPLAIELACARLRTLPVEAVAARLDDRFRLLTGGSRTAMPRHQTLLAVVDWSWELLGEAERRLAAAMSAFSNGATGETIAAVFGDVDEALSGLVDKSFVELDESGRYQMLETIRAYAAKRLAESGRADDVRRRVSAYLTDQMEIAESAMRGPEQGRWLTWTFAERDNLGSALRWSIESGDTATAHRLAGSMGWFWLLSGAHAEAAAWLAQVVVMEGEADRDARALSLAHYGMNVTIMQQEPFVPDPLRQAAEASASRHPVLALSNVIASMFGYDVGKVRMELPQLLDHEDRWVRATGRAMRAFFALYSGEPDSAEQDLLIGLEQFREIGDRWAITTLTSALGGVRAMRGDHAGARALLEETTRLAVDLGLADVEAQAFVSLGLLRARSGDFDGAAICLKRARSINERCGSGSPHMGLFLNCAFAELARRKGDLQLAERTFRSVLEVVPPNRGPSREMRSHALSGFAFTEIGLGRPAEAEKLATQICELASRAEDRLSMALAALVYALAALDEAEPGRAACLIGIGERLRGMADRGNPDAAEAAERAKQALGDAAYNRAYQLGLCLSVEDASAALADGARAAFTRLSLGG